MEYSKEHLEKVKNSFQKFYDYELDENDAKEIIENLFALSEWYQSIRKRNNNKP